MAQRGHSRQNDIEAILEALIRAGRFTSAVVASKEGLPLATAGYADTTLIAAVAASIKDLVERAHQAPLEITSRNQRGAQIVIRYFSVQEERLLLSITMPAGRHPYRRLTSRAIHRIQQVLEK